MLTLYCCSLIIDGIIGFLIDEVKKHTAAGLASPLASGVAFISDMIQNSLFEESEQSFSKFPFSIMRRVSAMKYVS